MSTPAKPKRRSISKTHERISQLGWEPSYHQPVATYPTRYHLPKKAKDPTKQIYAGVPADGAREGRARLRRPRRRGPLLQLADDPLARNGFTGAPSPGGLHGETVLHLPSK